MEINLVKNKLFIHCMNIREGSAVFLVVLYVIIMLFVLYSFSSNKEWRLPKGSCPDFWVSDENGNCCNYHNAENSTCQKFDLSNENLCDVAKIAYANNYPWDGITYGFGKNPPCSISLS